MKPASLLKSVLLFCAAVLAACGAPSRASRADDLFSAAAPGDTIRAVQVPMDRNYMAGYPVLAVGDRVIFNNSGHSSHLFDVYRSSGDSLIREGGFLCRGRGPYEMMFAVLSYDERNNELNMLAPYNAENRFCRVRLDRFEALYDCSTWEYAQLPIDGTIMHPQLSDRSVFLAIGGKLDSYAMFSLLDAEAKRLTPLGLSYPSLPVELSAFQCFSLWNGKLYRQPFGKRFLYSAQAFKYLLLLDWDDRGGIVVAHRICDRLPELRSAGPSSDAYSFEEHCELGFHRIAVDEKHIYVGYTQHNYADLQELAQTGYIELPVARINVFDWEGRFVRRLVPDVPLTGPMIVHDGALIACAADPDTGEERIVRYAL